MRSRLVFRRSATALGIYGSTALGVLGTIVAARILGPADFGRFALVVATVGLFQLLLDLTSEEALVKYGFRYVARADWGRFRRLFAVTIGLKTTGAAIAAARSISPSTASSRSTPYALGTIAGRCASWYATYNVSIFVNQRPDRTSRQLISVQRCSIREPAP